MGNWLAIDIMSDNVYGYSREVVRGVYDRAKVHGRWRCRRLSLTPEHLRSVIDGRPAGVIALVSKSWMVQPLVELGVPVVNTSSVLETPLPWVGVDNVEVGRQAARHLIERGRRNLVIKCVSQKTLYSRERIQGFREEAERLSDQPVQDWADIRLLRDIPPLGVFATTDAEAVDALRQCEDAGVSVPGRVAVVGVDNDDIVALSTTPAISSVDVSGRQIGYHAAALLENLIAGAPWPAQPIRIAPVGVVARGSTDIAMDQHPVVAAARQYITEHLNQPLGVRDLVEHVGVSRSTLEAVFRDQLKQSPLTMIHRARIDRACELLRTTRLPMPQIAHATGFHDARRLWAVFRRTKGTTPSDYRKQFQVT